MATHVDRTPLVSSAILNVDQDVDEPWPIEVYGHDGKAYNITMEPGDMVLYESHSVLHGRPFPLKGRYFANIFIHFEPVGHTLRHNAQEAAERAALGPQKNGGHENEMLDGLPPDSNCKPSTVAFMISGQFERFVFRDNQGPLITESSLGCGVPVIDVYIVLHRGDVARPYTGTLSAPPYITDNVTIEEIEKYYLEQRNASTVHVKFVDNEHMSEFDNDMKNLIFKRRIPKEQKVFFLSNWIRSTRSISRMLYMRHLVYSMTLQQEKMIYDVYVSQREDAFFYQPLNFTSMGYERDHVSVPIKPRVYVEKWCEFYGSYSDKIHIGNQLGMSTLFGRERNDFLNLMMRFSDFGYAWKDAVDPFQSERFVQDLLLGASLNQTDMKRVDLRYVNKTRCVASTYLSCKPQAAKAALSDLGIESCRF